MYIDSLDLVKIYYKKTCKIRIQILWDKCHVKGLSKCRLNLTKFTILIKPSNGKFIIGQCIAHKYEHTYQCATDNCFN